MLIAIANNNEHSFQARRQAMLMHEGPCMRWALALGTVWRCVREGWHASVQEISITPGNFSKLKRLWAYF